MTHFNHQGTTGTQKSCLNSCLGFRQFASVSCRWIQILDSQSRLCVLACRLICVEVFGSQRDIARNFIIIYLAKPTVILLSVVIVQDNLAAWTDFSLRCPVSLALCFLVNVQRETWNQGQSVSQSVSMNRLTNEQKGNFWYVSTRHTIKALLVLHAYVFNEFNRFFWQHSLNWSSANVMWI